MTNTDFEKCFGDFIERREYDDAAAALFAMVRASFNAGWEAAGGSPQEAQPVIRLIPKSPVS